VGCCREHKTTCPALAKIGAADNESKGAGEPVAASGKGTAAAASSRSADLPSKKSKYLPSDVLTADPLENAVKRRRMLSDDEEDSDDDEPGWRITREMMDRIDNSAWLKSELGDGGLRQLIAEIDGADEAAAAAASRSAYGGGRRYNGNNGRFANMVKVKTSPREIALERTKRTNPNFARFIDRMLLTAGIVATASRGDGTGGDGSMVSLEAMLAGEDVDEPVQLVPVPRLGGAPLSEPMEAASKADGHDADDSSSSSSSSSDDSSDSSSDGSSDDSDSPSEDEE